MVLNREKQTIEHKYFKDLIDYFDEDDVMILNDTKVFPGKRVVVCGYGDVGKGTAAVLFLKAIAMSLWS